MLIPLLAAVAGLAAAQAPADERPHEAYVPYASTDGIVGWRAIGEGGVFVKSLTGGWYYAATINRCRRLRTATNVAFITRGLSDLDRYGAVVAQGSYCPLRSVVRSAPPPGEQ